MRCTKENTATNPGYLRLFSHFILIFTYLYLQQHDLVSDPITEKFDLIFSRHTLMHLFFTDIEKVLKNFIASGSSYLLMTSQSNQNNKDISSERLYKARYRPVNFFKPPFSLPAPICVGKDTNKKDMFIILYELSSIRPKAF